MVVVETVVVAGTTCVLVVVSVNVVVAATVVVRAGSVSVRVTVTVVSPAVVEGVVSVAGGGFVRVGIERVVLGRVEVAVGAT